MSKAQEVPLTLAERIQANTAAKAPKTMGERLDRTVRQTNVGLKKAARHAGKHKAALIASGIGLGAAGGAYALGRHLGKKATQSES